MINENKCLFCGTPSPNRHNRFCMRCGAPLKTGSATGRFFLAMLQCLGFWAFIEIVTALFTVAYQAIVIAGMRDDSFVSQSVYEAAFWAQYSKYSAFVMIAADIIAIALIMLFFKLIRKKGTSEVQLCSMPVGAFGGAAASGLSAQFLTTGLLTLLYTLFPALSASSPDLGGTFDQMFGGGSHIAEIMYIGIVAPFAEEFLYRGIVYTRLRRVIPKGAAIVMSALIFGAVHGNLEQFSYAFPFGILLAALFEKYNSIWASYAVHMAFNVGSYLLAVIPMDSFASVLASILCGAGLLLLCIAMFFGTKPIYEKTKPPVADNTDERIPVNEAL